MNGLASLCALPATLVHAARAWGTSNGRRVHLFICASGALAAIASCSGIETPDALQCNPPVVSVPYTMSIGCGAGGPIVLNTQAHSCTIAVTGARAADLPFDGKFIAAGDGGTFDLGDGNWTLDGNVRFSTKPPLDENVDCTVTPAAGGAFDVSCAVANCTVVGEGEDEGSSCTSDICLARLTPGDGGSATISVDDAGLGSDIDSGFTDLDAESAFIGDATAD